MIKKNKSDKKYMIGSHSNFSTFNFSDVLSTNEILLHVSGTKINVNYF